MEEVRRKAFPPRHALVNPIAQNGFAMRFVKEEKISNIGPNTSVDDNPVGTIMNATVQDGSQMLLSVCTRSNLCDAILVRRPYARIVEADAGIVGVLRFKIDGEQVAEGAIKRFLVKDTEDPILDEPFEWKATKMLFLSGRIEGGKIDLDQEERIVEEARKSLKAIGLPTGERSDLPDKASGNEVVVLDAPASIFAPNGSRLEISAADIGIPGNKPVTLEVGFLAATYTTRDVAGARRTIA